jgi:signal transduction histidine kinase
MYQRGARLTAQTTAIELSTGYGLAIAKEVSNMVDGSLSCQSELGQGAEFIIVITKVLDAKQTTE